MPAQVVKALPGDESIKVKAQEISWYTYDDQPDQGKLVVIDNDVLDFNFRTVYDKSYAAPESGDTITCLIESGVKVGTSTSSGFAFTVGTWNESGITLKLINNGYIVGKGGNGGSYPGAKNGEDGADALYTRQAVTVTNNGTIGGGGGGVGSSRVVLIPVYSGGGGGAGYTVGQGGMGYFINTENPGSDGTTTEGGDAGFADSGGQGGDGGDLGQAGQNGTGSYPFAPGSGGAAGVAVDGDSYITWDVTGTIAGSQIKLN